MPSTMVHKISETLNHLTQESTGLPTVSIEDVVVAQSRQLAPHSNIKSTKNFAKL